jgi:hypothetical protein
VSAIYPRERLRPATELRVERLRAGVLLADAARVADMSMKRASIIERYPEQARPGEIERLRAALARVVSAS